MTVNDRQERAVAVAELLREARSQLFALCEATVDEAADMIQRDPVGIVAAYSRGRKVEAKAIARAMSEVFRDLLSKAESAR